MTKNNYSLFPQKKLHPYDGMSINAAVWDEAHNYHAQTQKAHQYFLHGAGIITGLEVVASDPADSVVYILPGAAIDTAGQMIVLAEPVAYDLGQKIEGKLHLLLLHREIKIQAAQDEESNAPAYLQDEYVIIARPDLIDLPHVELARIDRQSTQAPITDALNFHAPQRDSIDLRFRQYVCPPPAEQVLVGVCSLAPSAAGYAQGLIHLARPLSDQTPYHLIVEDAVPLDPSIFGYRLIYLLAGRSSKFNKEQADVLHTYLENGGRLLVEFCEPIEEKDVANLMKSAGIQVDPLTASHPLYQSPYLFFALPDGSQPANKCALWSWGASVICSSGGYGSLWSGQSAPSRGVLRDALEWGVNMVNYLLSHA